ncbi:hypothetical protein FMUND_364 [Fusarium mundagurra]|uniref:Uncharacterized protein n=1 Tax=Fusarium mundagurra TaxID=1567541 RepID=A0A8H5Z518_9HYPO|nr:hypothetical protein FMUND_364 [Fusarium mundagurra]
MEFEEHHRGPKLNPTTQVHQLQPNFKDPRTEGVARKAPICGSATGQNHLTLVCRSLGQVGGIPFALCFRKDAVTSRELIVQAAGILPELSLQDGYFELIDLTADAHITHLTRSSALDIAGIQIGRLGRYCLPYSQVFDAYFTEVLSAWLYLMTISPNEERETVEPTKIAGSSCIKFYGYWASIRLASRGAGIVDIDD